MLEIPIFGPDDGAAAVMSGAQRLELNRAGSYGEFAIISVSCSCPSLAKSAKPRGGTLFPPPIPGRPVPSQPHPLLTYP